jgi:pantothenate kinase
MDSVYADIVSRIHSSLSSQPDCPLLVAIAGPPGSGKTTVAAKVVELLNNSTSKQLAPNGYDSKPLSTETRAISISVDGFHFPHKYLDTLPNREEAYLRRGAPWTFDVDGIIGLVRRLKDSARIPLSARSIIKAPSFDHARKDPVEDDIQIPPEATIVLLEGNYLLLDVDPWREISRMVDLRIFVEVDVECARARVARRHVQAGIEDTFEKGLERFDGNDALNGDLIRNNHTQCDVRVESFDITS